MSLSQGNIKWHQSWELSRWCRLLQKGMFGRITFWQFCRHFRAKVQNEWGFWWDLQMGMKISPDSLEVRMKCSPDFPTFPDCGMIQLWPAFWPLDFFWCLHRPRRLKEIEREGIKRIIQQPDIAATENWVSCTLKHFQRGLGSPLLWIIDTQSSDH